MTGTSSGIGGLSGFNAGTISSSFWNTTTSGKSTSAGGIGLSTAQMQTQANYTSATVANGNLNPAWDFASTWVIYDGHTSPLLKSFLTPLVITADNISKTYDKTGGGTLQNAVYSLSGAPSSGHLFGLGSAYASDINAGIYSAASGIWSDQQGYVISFSGATLTIGKATLAVTATANNKIYNGTSAATTALSDNRIAGDSLTVSGTSAFSSKNVGNGKTVTVSGIGVTGADAGNYTWNTSTTTTASITPTALNVTGATAQNKTYDGSTSATVTGATLSGLIAGDNVTVAGASFASKNAGTGKSVTIALSGSDLGNYTVTLPMLTADIIRAVLNVSASVTSRTYDGTTSATAALADNRVAGDALTISATAAFSDKNVGSDKTVTVSGITVTGTDAANYTWNSSTTASASISAAPLALTGATALNRTYNGTTAASLGGGTLSGLVAGDNVVIAGVSFADKNVGTGKTVSVLLSGSDLGNYSFSVPILTADIIKAVLNISATASDKVYNGTTSATASLTDNRATGDALLISGNASFSDKNAGNGKTVTVSGIGVTGADVGNYTWNISTTTIASITPAALNLTGATALDKIYDGTAIATLIGGTLSGFVTGDNVSITGAVFGDEKIGADKPVSVLLGGRDSADYKLPSGILHASIFAAADQVQPVSVPVVSDIIRQPAIDQAVRLVPLDSFLQFTATRDRPATKAHFQKDSYRPEEYVCRYKDIVWV